MKKLKIVLLLVLTLGLSLTSCSSDDDNGTVDGNIEGKWIFSKIGTMTGDKEVFIDYPNHEPGCNKNYVEITADGKWKNVEYYGSECTEESDEGTWTRNGNTISVSYDDEIETGTILKLTNTELKLKNTYTEEGITVDAIILFTRAN